MEDGHRLWRLMAIRWRFVCEQIHCWYTTVKRSDKGDGQNLQVFPEKRRVVMSRSLVFAEWKPGTDFHWCLIENKKIKTFLFFINFRVHFITIPIFGATEALITSQEERLALTYKRQSYLHTGPHPSPRSVSVWRSTISTDSLALTSKLTLFTRSSLMGNSSKPH